MAVVGEAEEFLKDIKLKPNWTFSMFLNKAAKPTNRSNLCGGQIRQKSVCTRCLGVILSAGGVAKGSGLLPGTAS